MALVASTFVGTPYEPGTLELPGPERLVVNLRTFDCVTLVEHALVLARLITRGGEAVLADDETFRRRVPRRGSPPSATEAARSPATRAASTTSPNGWTTESPPASWRR
jgi:hypothetical protein